MSWFDEEKQEQKKSSRKYVIVCDWSLLCYVRSKLGPLGQTP